MTAQDILKQYFGYDSFRPGQDELVRAILSGRDTLGIMPTGAGKSICYQVPAMLFPGLTLVISPLISLMKDQVGALVEAGVPAACINSAMSAEEFRDALYFAGRGQYKLLYVAPERLTAPSFLEFAKRVPISMVTVDEAHCISQWGQDFRPSYLKILDFLAELPERPLVSAFTATATAEVRDDIVQALGLHEPFIKTTGFDSPNLYFAVEQPTSKGMKLLQLLNERKDKSGIVYCSTRKNVEEICDLLLSRGLPATRYHAGLDPEERRENQDDFLYDRKTIMVATNAFGMGIDKSNVSFVIHYNMPKNMESYYQEAGRAGRDGQPADCILLYSGQDVRMAEFLIERSHEAEDESIDEAVIQSNAEKIRRLKEKLDRDMDEKKHLEERLEYLEGYWEDLENDHKRRERAIEWMKELPKGRDGVVQFLNGVTSDYCKAFVLSITVHSPLNYTVHWYDDTRTEVVMYSNIEDYRYTASYFDGQAMRDNCYRKKYVKKG